MRIESEVIEVCVLSFKKPMPDVLIGRDKSRTGSTRTASLGQINSDRLGSNKKIRVK